MTDSGHKVWQTLVIRKEALHSMDGSGLEQVPRAAEESGITILGGV